MFGVGGVVRVTGGGGLPGQLQRNVLDRLHQTFQVQIN